MDKNIYTPQLFSDAELDPLKPVVSGPVQCLGMEFENEEARREYFRDELRRKLPELRQIEGFPIGEDEDIIRLSDPPYYTACPNPWLNDFIQQWEEEKKDLTLEGKRSDSFKVSTPYADGIKQGKNSTIYNAHTYHTKVPHEVIMRYILHYTQPGDIVLDGFSGTGMTGVAASACSTKNNLIESEFRSNGHIIPQWGQRHAICSDLSPLCFHISSNYNRQCDVNELRNNVSEIISKLEEKFGYLYEISLKNEGKGHINYFVWSEIVACNNCGKELNVHNLSYDYDTKTLYKKIKCPYCGTEQEKNKATKLINTLYHPILNEVVSQIKYEQTLVNYSIEKSGRRFAKIPMSEINLQLEGFIPTYKFPKEGNNIPQLFTVGCYTINDVYPIRTQYVLAYLYDLIIKNKKYSNQLLYIFTSMLPKLTRMNRYMPQHGSRALVGPMANVLYIPPQFVENNPIDQFEYQANKVIKAYSEIKSGSVIHICSATNQMIADNSIDYIFTDPPFGSNIMYSELNIIAESWLGIRTDNKDEAIANKAQHKGILEYQNIITQCLKEYYRILKPGHWMTVEFSNTSAAFWNTLQHSIQSAGFVITAVSDLDKERGGLYAMIGPTAVKQDLAITCYKPSENLAAKFNNSSDKRILATDFVEELLQHLPVHIEKNQSTTAVIERNPKILYDRLISYYVQKGWPIPMDAGEFQDMLRNTFIERDGMFFTASQALEYEEKRKKSNNFVPMALFISSEAEGIEWLNLRLKETPKTYQEIQPDWMKDMIPPKKGDRMPELLDILEENFIKDEDGYWRRPDPEKAADLEALRLKRMAKEFALYLEQARKPKAKRMKDCRLEVLRYGFKDCYKRKDYEAIIAVGDHIQESLLLEDEILLQYYDSAAERV